MKRRTLAVFILIAACAGLLTRFDLRTAVGQDIESSEPELPTEVPEVDVVAQTSQSYVISVVDFGGPKELGTGAAAIVRRNFEIMPGYRVKAPESLPHDPQANGIDFDMRGWASAGIDGVIKGSVEQTSPDNLVVAARFFKVGARSNPAIERRYSGEPKMLRKWMHAFSNDVLKVLSNKKGVFEKKITYAKRESAGQKSIYCSELNGYGELRVTRANGLSLLPMFDEKNRIWFTRMTDDGMFISRTGVKGKPIVSAKGLNMAPSYCHGRLYFTSSREGNSEIYSANEDGGDIKRLTNNPAIDVSPTCGPDGRIAFVSARHGSPQIFVMNGDGSGQKRVTFKGGHNQTPSWCQDPSNPNLIAFTGRDAGMDIFTVDIKTQEYTRVTQGQGINKDPTFSPDCRMLAFVSDRRSGPGVYISSLSGFSQTRVVEGNVETVRFQP